MKQRLLRLLREILLYPHINTVEEALQFIQVELNNAAREIKKEEVIKLVDEVINNCFYEETVDIELKIKEIFQKCPQEEK